jgi:hypothetical protein
MKPKTKPTQEQTDAEMKKLLAEAPAIVENAIARGWIKPPKFRLTDAQIESSLKRVH